MTHLVAGGPAVCEGTVLHRRHAPERHEFTYPVSWCWLDPERPDDLTHHHPLWSSTRPAPVRFRRRDYGAERHGSLRDEVVRDLAGIGIEGVGEVRLLTQVRRWGWLFNPISIFLAWSADAADTAPIGAVLEVTNTPWHERHRYALPLQPASDGAFETRFPKTLHVSPFLGMDHDYRLRIRSGAPDRLSVDVDVHDRPSAGTGRDDDALGPIRIHTALRLDRRAANRDVLGASLRSGGLPTHRVSAGIHRQALRLHRLGVPFVAHPKRSSTDAPADPSAAPTPPPTDTAPANYSAAAPPTAPIAEVSR